MILIYHIAQGLNMSVSDFDVLYVLCMLGWVWWSHRASQLLTLLIHSDLINLIFKLLSRSFHVNWPDCTGWSNGPCTHELVHWRRPCSQIIPQVHKWTQTWTLTCVSPRILLSLFVHLKRDPRPTIWTMMSLSRMMIKKRGSHNF